MTQIMIGGDVLRDINKIVSWFGENGYPAEMANDSQWQGAVWQIEKQQPKYQSSYPQYCIKIDNRKLMDHFLMRWG